ncbi:hypothetical protein AB0H17_27045 [Streptomyces olivoreticuli]
MSYGAGIQRGPMAGDHFTQIANALFRDRRLSFKAKGIFGLISTHRDGWRVTVATLVRSGTDGKSAVTTGLRELEKFGYLERGQEHNDDGTFGEAYYRITDVPAHLFDLFGDAADQILDKAKNGSSEPLDGFPSTDDPAPGHRPTKNTTHKKTKPKNARTAPPARSAADAAGQLPVVEGQWAAGGCAASDRTSGDTETEAATVRADVAAVAAAFPGELRTALERSARTALPRTLARAVEAELEHRTAAQLAERIVRRWDAHGYAYDALSADGGGLRRPVGVAVALVRAGECPDPSCEDGTVIGSGAACRVCGERRANRRERRRAGLPVQQQATDGGASWWECAAPECRAPGRGVLPEDGLCPTCRRSGVEAAEALARLLGR